MRDYGSIFLFLLALVVLPLYTWAGVHVSAADMTTNDVFLAFPGDEIIDEASVVVGIGRPVQTYRLRVVFSPHLYNCSESMGSITLYNSDRLRLTSATYEIVIPGRVGRDIIEIGAVRWKGLIDTRPRAWRGVNPANTVDGLLFVGGTSSPAPGNYWKAAYVNRLGITWVHNETSLQELRREQAPLSGDYTTQSLEEITSSSTHPWSTIESLVSGIASIDEVTVEGYSNPLGEAEVFQFSIAPDSHLTRIPTRLFEWYFHDKNFYRDSPLEWKPLVLTFKNGLRITIDGSSILPLTDNRDLTDDTNSDGLRSLNAIISALQNHDYQLSADEKLENSGNFLGFNNIKMVPHNNDGIGIVLGGHILWTSSTLEIYYGSSVDELVHLSISAHATGTELSMFECVVIVVSAIFYIRWKFGTLWIDFNTDSSGNIRSYFFIISTDSILWPFVLPLWALPVVAIVYWNNLSNVLPATLEIFVICLSVISWLIASISSVWLVLVHWKAIRRLWYDGLREFSYDPANGIRRWFNTISVSYGKSDADNNKANRPYVSAQPDRYNNKTGNSVPHYAERNHNQGQFFWVPVAPLILRDTFVNMVALLTLWMMIAPIDTPIFATVMSLIILTIMTYTSVHHSVTLIYLNFWPLLSRHRKRRYAPNPLQWAVLATVISITVINFYLVIHGALYPAIATSSALYGNSDDSIDAVIVLFIIVTLYIVTQFAHSFLISLFLRRDKEVRKTA